MFIAIVRILIAVAALSTADRTAALERGLAAEAPWLTPDQVEENVARALDVETDEVPAEILLAIAWRESKYDPTARPGCGVMQVLRKYAGRTGCAYARLGVGEGYVMGAWALSLWVEPCSGKRARGVTVTECILNAYAEGGAAGRRGWGVKGCKRHWKCDRAAGPLGRARRIAGGAELDDA